MDTGAPTLYIWRLGTPVAWLRMAQSAIRSQILMQWLEKFVQHGNGIALVPERTSTKWWQEAASRSDLLLFVNQRIPFISSTRDDATTCAIGSTLIAIGERGTRGLITASRNKLGLLLKPYSYCVIELKRLGW